MSTMNVCTFLFCLLIFTGSFGLSAQQKDSIDITNTVEKYIVGWRTGNAEILSEAFDMDAGVVLWIGKDGEDEQLNSMKLADLVSKTKPHEGYGVGYEIQKYEIIDAKLAVVFVKVPLGKNHYIDCLELQKINGVWKIILKSFVYFREE